MLLGWKKKEDLNKITKNNGIKDKDRRKYFDECKKFKSKTEKKKRDRGRMRRTRRKRDDRDKIRINC